MSAVTVPNPPAAGVAPHPGVPALLERLRAQLQPASRIFPNEPLARRTTLRVGGAADVLVEPGDEADLARTLQAAKELGVPRRLLGRGSNLLVRDHGLRGLVISLSHPCFAQLSWVSNQLLRCGAGVRLREVSNEARRQGLAGLEFLAGIPGSVGGALRMNAGAWNAMTFDRLERVRFMTPEGEVRDVPATEVPAVYRRCPLFVDHIALEAVFRGEPSTREAVEARLNELNQKRWASQPAAPSAGCIFKNPATIPAGRLVDELGLKGLRRGGASISTVHGNFIVNDGDATAADILWLIDEIRQRARETRGVELETEVEILGE